MAHGEHTGLGMRRGTLLCRREPASVPATFGDNGEQSLPFLTLLLHELQPLGDAFAEVSHNAAIQRYLGDRACIGLGEILVLQPR